MANASYIVLSDSSPSLPISPAEVVGAAVATVESGGQAKHIPAKPVAVKNKKDIRFSGEKSAQYAAFLYDAILSLRECLTSIFGVEKSAALAQALSDHSQILLLGYKNKGGTLIGIKLDGGTVEDAEACNPEAIACDDIGKVHAITPTVFLQVFEKLVPFVNKFVDCMYVQKRTQVAEAALTALNEEKDAAKLILAVSAAMEEVVAFDASLLPYVPNRQDAEERLANVDSRLRSVESDTERATEETARAIDAANAALSALELRDGASQIVSHSNCRDHANTLYGLMKLSRDEWVDNFPHLAEKLEVDDVLLTLLFECTCAIYVASECVVNMSNVKYYEYKRKDAGFKKMAALGSRKWYKKATGGMLRPESLKKRRKGRDASLHLTVLADDVSQPLQLPPPLAAAREEASDCVAAPVPVEQQTATVTEDRFDARASVGESSNMAHVQEVSSDDEL